jgi:hypothetical protein
MAYAADIYIYIAYISRYLRHAYMDNHANGVFFKHELQCLCHFHISLVDKKCFTVIANLNCTEKHFVWHLRISNRYCGFLPCKVGAKLSLCSSIRVSSLGNEWLTRSIPKFTLTSCRCCPPGFYLLKKMASLTKKKITLKFKCGSFLRTPIYRPGGKL